MNCSTETDKKKAASKFGLSRSAVRVLDQLNGPLDGGRGAPFLVILKLKSGTHEHKLINTLGPVELWAFSTTPADVGLRTRLYERLGPQEARKRLAKRFPNGSAKSEIARRTTIMMERGQVGPEYNAGIPAILADELCAEARE